MVKITKPDVEQNRSAPCGVRVSVYEGVGVLSTEPQEDDGGSADLTLRRFFSPSKFQLHAGTATFYLDAEELAAFRQALEEVCARASLMGQERRSVEAPHLVTAHRAPARTRPARPHRARRRVA